MLSDFVQKILLPVEICALDHYLALVDGLRGINLDWTNGTR